MNKPGIQHIFYNKNFIELNVVIETNRNNMNNKLDIQPKIGNVIYPTNIQQIIRIKKTIYNINIIKSIVALDYNDVDRYILENEHYHEVDKSDYCYINTTTDNTILVKHTYDELKNIIFS